MIGKYIKRKEQQAVEASRSFNPSDPRDAALARRRLYLKQCKMDAVIVVSPKVIDLDQYSPSRKVCLDNLPIDVTEEEIRDALDFSGGVKSVEIYNQRPDLDPLLRPNTVEEDSENPKRLGRKRKKRVKKLKATTRGFFYESPNKLINTTPVYAFVDFETEEALEKFFTDSVRIFGMVMRKHCSTVSEVADLTTLYLEVPANIPKSSNLHREGLSAPVEYSLEIEMKLRELVGDEVYICMAMGEHEWAMPDMCEISFPSHELAMWTKKRIEESQQEGKLEIADGAEYNLGWFKMREDAPFHWRREVEYF